MTIGVIGGGAWGTALAQVAAARGPVLLWAREAAVVEAINRDHANPVFLPGIALDPAIRATDRLDELAGCAMLLVVVPAQYLRGVLAAANVGAAPLILCAKGIEAASGMLMSEVAADVMPAAQLAVLSGPSFAGEVARGLPTALTLASSDEVLSDAIVDRLARPSLRLYRSSDVIGAEIGGAVKNVLAIACGVVEGAGLGENARAALIARGFAEMVRFGLARGARAETLAGLAGLGDLVLTCSSSASRNFALGKGLGEGRAAAELLAGRLSVAEGAATAPVLAAAARRAGVAMPITEAVCDLLAGTAARDVIEALLARPSGSES